MRKKRFDCVEMKREGSKRVYDAVKDMSLEQEVEFWHQRTLELRREIRAHDNSKLAPKTVRGWPRG